MCKEAVCDHDEPAANPEQAYGFNRWGGGELYTPKHIYNKQIRGCGPATHVDFEVVTCFNMPAPSLVHFTNYSTFDVNLN